MRARLARDSGEGPASPAAAADDGARERACGGGAGVVPARCGPRSAARKRRMRATAGRRQRVASRVGARVEGAGGGGAAPRARLFLASPKGRGLASAAWAARPVTRSAIVWAKAASKALASRWLVGAAPRDAAAQSPGRIPRVCASAQAKTAPAWWMLHMATVFEWMERWIEKVSA